MIGPRIRKEYKGTWTINVEKFINVIWDEISNYSMYGKSSKHVSFVGFWETIYMISILAFESDTCILPIRTGR